MFFFFLSSSHLNLFRGFVVVVTLEHNHLIIIILVLLLVLLLVLPLLVFKAWSLLGDAVRLADGGLRGPGLVV
jgi:hypothetical protein